MTQAFDPLAAAYDEGFTNSPIGRYLRAQVQTRLNRHFHPGDHVLELGCGTGQDALHLASRGVRVTATDVSQSMLAAAGAKAGDNPLVTFANLDLRRLPAGDWKKKMGNFSGAFSNFGPLNCLDNWRPLAAWLSERVKPGGVVALGVMSPLCVWEPLWHGLHGDFKTATRRWRKNTTFQPEGASEAITISYPTIRRITRDFAPDFRRVYVQGVGLALPPSDVFGVIEKRPRLLRLLTGLDKRLARYPRLAPFADHYWIEFVKT